MAAPLPHHGELSKRAKGNLFFPTAVFDNAKVSRWCGRRNGFAPARSTAEAVCPDPPEDICSMKGLFGAVRSRRVYEHKPRGGTLLLTVAFVMLAEVSANLQCRFRAMMMERLKMAQIAPDLCFLPPKT
jgi:hypothetical protein